MPLASRLIYSIDAEDNTGPTCERFREAMGSAFASAAADAERVGESLEEGMEEAVDEVEQGPLERLKEVAGSSGVQAGLAFAAAFSLALRGLNDALDFIEERRNELEIRLFTPTEAEEDLVGLLGRAGFTAAEGAAGALTNRAFGLDPATGDAQNLALTVAQLNRAGVNTRFLPQVAQRFGITDPNELVAQLGVGADVVSQAGVDFEEVYSEIADNPQVYGAFPTFAHAAQFIVGQGLAPAEVTIQLEQGFLAPTGGTVTGDPFALSGITPTAAERYEQGQSGFTRAFTGAVGAIPVVGGEGQEFISAINQISESLFGAHRIDDIFSGRDNRTDRTGTTRTFTGEAGDVLVDGQAVVPRLIEAVEANTAALLSTDRRRAFEDQAAAWAEARATRAGQGHPLGTN